jgi:hypothetical protein
MTTLLLEPLRAVARGTVLKRDLCYAVTRHRDRIGLAKISFTRFTKENHCIHAACHVECLLSCVRHITHIAGWSSLVARQAHNLKVLGSNPNPATTFGAFLETERPLFIAFNRRFAIRPLISSHHATGRNRGRQIGHIQGHKSLSRLRMPPKQSHLCGENYAKSTIPASRRLMKGV